jgi:two-component system, chemotaxis family, chemotaxis protein CheY
MRVLIADDQRDAGASLADLVRLCRHEVVGVVTSGLEAMTAYTSRQPDIVLMDYWMAKLNGATACRNILAKDPAARIIFVSGGVSPAEVADLGAVTVLTKPVGLQRLYDALQTAANLPVDLPFSTEASPDLSDALSTSSRSAA